MSLVKIKKKLLVKSDLELAIKLFDQGDSSKDLFDLFIQLIDCGFAEANYFVGCMYEDGSNGVERNLEHARFYYQQSIDELGYLEGFLAVARFYYFGHGVPEDFGIAYKYFSHVAHYAKHPVAYVMLGRMNQYGQGTEINAEAARTLYINAIQLGNISGMINRAVLERSEGYFFRAVFLYCKASLMAFCIRMKSPKDARLRDR